MLKSAIDESERETVVRICGDKASVFTGSLPMFNKLTRLGWRESSSMEHYAWLEGPAKGLSFRKVGAPTRAQKTGRVMTEEQKKRMREGLKKTRNVG